MRKVLFLSLLLTLTASLALADGTETCPGTVIDLTGWTPGSAQVYTDTGTTVGKANDYTYTNYGCGYSASGNDVVYQFTPPVNLSLVISLCSTATSWDSMLFVTNGCPTGAGTCIYNDDSCGLLSEIPCTEFTAGTTYYLFVDGYGANGAFTLTVTECFVAPCDIIVPPSAIDEGEVCGTDTNGGCLMATPAFTTIACNTFMLGSSWFDGSTRDTDWYQMITTNTTRFTIEVTAEFQTLFGIVETSTPGSGSCSDTTGYVNPAGYGDTPCTMSSIVSDPMPPGTYWFFVAPQFTNNVSCGQYEDYVLRVTCEVITTGACCDPAVGTCTADVYEADCLLMYGGTGVWQGGVSCTPNPCPGPPPPNDECANAIAITAPYPKTISGTTVDATIDCPGVLDWQSVWYTFEAPYAQNAVDIDYCPTAEEIYSVGIICYPPQTAGDPCPDDCSAYIFYSSYEFVTCPSTLTNPIIHFLLPGPAVYYLPILTSINSSDDPMAFSFEINVTSLDPCVTCPSGGILEGEPACGADYVDTYNGGCNSTPAVFQTINNGDVICGQSGNYLVGGTSSSRDTDWFTFTTTGSNVVTFEAYGEFPMQILLFNSGTGDCSDYTQVGLATANYCETATITTILDAGTYWAWVGPSVFTGFDCEVPYVAELNWVPYVPPVFCESPAVSYNSSAVVAIPDADCPNLVNSPITVTDAGLVGDVDVRINITHTWVSDLTILLTNGTTSIVLADGVGGSGDNFVNTVFDDEAIIPIASGAAPFTGFFQPAELLSAFDGIPMAGTWSLEVCDWYTGDTGTIDSWDLCLTSASVPPTSTPYTGPVPATGPIGIGILAFALSALLGLSTLRKK